MYTIYCFNRYFEIGSTSFSVLFSILNLNTSICLQSLLENKDMLEKVKIISRNQVVIM